MERNKAKSQSFCVVDTPQHSHSLQAIKYNKKHKKYSIHHSRQNLQHNQIKLKHMDSSKYHRNNGDYQTNKKLDSSSVISKTNNQRKHVAMGTSITMKNLRIVNHHLTSAKNSIQNTSRSGPTKDGAISNRILKDIVYNSQVSNTTRTIPKQITVDIDCSLEGLQGQQNLNSNVSAKYFHGNLAQKETKRLASEFNCEQLSQNQQEQTEKLLINKCRKSKNKIIEQYSPLQIKDTNNWEDFDQKAKNSHIIYQDEIESESKQIYNQYHKNQTTSHSGSGELYTSPTMHCINTVVEDEGIDKFNCLNVHQDFNNDSYSIIQSALRSKQINSWSLSEEKHMKDNEKTRILELQRTKSESIFELEQISSLLQSQSSKYPEYSKCWVFLHPLLLQSLLLQDSLTLLQQNLTTLQKQSNYLKHQLFQHSRVFLTDNKQKQFTVRNLKNQILNDAQKAEEQLKLRICSKADFDHVVVFNQRVVLSSSREHKNPKGIYKQMFETQATRKFVMIAKKQLRVLSAYDSKLILQFFKKLQEFETAYQKAMKLQHNNSNNNENQFYQGVERLVEQIQEYVINIESLKGKIDRIKIQIGENQAEISKHRNNLTKLIAKESESVSNQYKMQSGKLYNFQQMLSLKYQEQFNKFRKLLQQKQYISNKLTEIDKQFKSIQDCIPNYDHEKLFQDAPSKQWA